MLINSMIFKQHAIIAHVKRTVFFAMMVLFAASSCKTGLSPQEEFRALKKSASRRLASYTFNPHTELLSRVTPIPRFLLDDIRKLDGRDDYRAYAPTAAEMEMVARYLDLIPPRHGKVLRERLIGIYFISPFMGGGLADWVLDDSGKVYAVLVINPEVFRRSLSEWLTYRENSCFRDDGLKVKMSVDAGSRFNGLMYLLLHEAAHIVDYVENHTPFVEPVLKEMTGRGADDRSFTRGIWADYGKPLPGSTYAMRGDVTFYGLSGGPKIPAGKAPDLYRGFAKSPFPSLYGSQSWAEDFAEMFMAYHLVKKLGQPFTVRVVKDGKELYRYSPMDAEKVKARFEYLEKLY